MPANFKINMSVVLKHLDTHNMEVYSAFRHKEVERKELDRLLGYVLPIWFTGIESSLEQYQMIFKFNQHANTSWADLKNHPELRAKLLAAIGPGKAVRHEYHRRDSNTVQTTLTGLLTMRYPDIRKQEIGLWCSVNSEAVLKDLCDHYGVQEEERNAIIAEYRRAVS